MAPATVAARACGAALTKEVAAALARETAAIGLAASATRVVVASLAILLAPARALVPAMAVVVNILTAGALATLSSTQRCPAAAGGAEQR